MVGVDHDELDAQDGYEDPPGWRFTAAETRILCTVLRRYLHPNVPWPQSSPTRDEIEVVLDHLFAYLAARSRWENLYLGDPADTPF